MQPLLLGIDAGHTVTKAVLFDLDGNQVAAGKGVNKQLSLHPAWQEREMDEAWLACVDAIRIATEGIDKNRITAIGVCGHSDGMYLLDKNRRPLRNAILATDNRAAAISDHLSTTVGDRLLPLLGQHIFPASPAVLLLWLRENEPENFKQIGSILNCKDFLRFKLSGVLGTDVSDASGGFCHMTTHEWSDEVMQLTKLEEIRGALPKISFASEVVGGLTNESAAQVGLPMGIPIIAGSHDVHAAALGVGAYELGRASVIFGTWSINQVFASKPFPDHRWHTRASFVPDRWLHMSTSPASASNANYFWNLFGVDDVSSLENLLQSADQVLLQEDRALYFPYLFGGPAGSSVGAHLSGLRGWHHKEHLAATVLEGVVFNHLHHLDMLRTKLGIESRIIATGGSMQSKVWAQLIADIFNTELEISDTQESGARGVATLAGMGVGLYQNPEEIVSKATRSLEVIHPNQKRSEFFAGRYEKYRIRTKELIGV